MGRPRKYAPPDTSHLPQEPLMPPAAAPEEKDEEGLIRPEPIVLQDDRIIYSHLPEEMDVSPEAKDLVQAITDARKIKFLLALAELGNRSRAARAARVSPATVWQWRRDDMKFDKAYARAIEVAADLIEDEAIRRATEGTVEPVFQGGHLVGGVRKMSDQLLMFVLKGLKPEKYKDKQDIHISVDVADRLIKARERTFGRLTEDEDGKDII